MMAAQVSRPDFLCLIIAKISSHSLTFFFLYVDGCEYPEDKGDGNCDDGNNNAGCNYDGGDCCPGDDPPSGWDNYCLVCECLEGIFMA